MRISTITNWAYAVTVVLTVLSAGAFLLSADAGVRERHALEEHLALDDLGEELALGAEERTDQARLYVMQGNARYLDAFRIDEGEELRRQTAARNIRQLEPSAAELTALDQVEADAAGLDKIEEEAVGAYGKGDRAGAQAMLFGADHDHAQTTLLADVQLFRELTDARTSAALNDAKAANDRYATMAKAVLALTGSVFLAVLYFVVRRRVAMPLMRMTNVVNKLARQDYAVELPADGRRDEIGEMNDAIQVFRTNGLERDRLDAERRQDQQTKDFILQMMHRLQACQTQIELADAVARFVPQIFPGLPGHLYVLNNTRATLILVGSWLSPRQQADGFHPNHCWGLRRGRPHVSNENAVDIPCQHLGGADIVSLCVPLTAQGDAVGLLYFEESSGAEIIAETSRLYLELMAENIGLAIANLQLREKLVHLAQRDALTGLLNRRSLDEEINRVAKADIRNDFSCLMIDIDHFKRFNDDFSHEAGDVVMQNVAQIMLDVVGERGKVFRFGGEEFTVLLPGYDGDRAFDLAEAIRVKISKAPLLTRGRALGTITVSIGTASASRSASYATLLPRADAALLAAKSSGRNITVRADTEPRPDVGFVKAS